MTDAREHRTAAATAARRRHGEEKRAAYLRQQGWTCTPPADRVPPHPWQEYNANGNTCHYPGCALPEPDHAPATAIPEHENTNRA